MDVSVLTSLRLRLATSARVVAAIDGTFSDSDAVLLEPRPEVRVGEVERAIEPCVALLPLLTTTDRESHRTDAIVEVTAYHCTLAQLGLLKAALETEINRSGKGCPVPVGPTGAGLCIVSQGLEIWQQVNREAGESRLYRCEGQIVLTYFKQ